MNGTSTSYVLVRAVPEWRELAFVAACYPPRDNSGGPVNLAGAGYV
jgi:hypothetical protein